LQHKREKKKNSRLPQRKLFFFVLFGIMTTQLLHLGPDLSDVDILGKRMEWNGPLDGTRWCVQSFLTQVWQCRQQDEPYPLEWLLRANAIDPTLEEGVAWKLLRQRVVQQNGYLHVYLVSEDKSEPRVHGIAFIDATTLALHAGSVSLSAVKKRPLSLVHLVSSPVGARLPDPKRASLVGFAPFEDVKSHALDVARNASAQWSPNFTGHESDQKSLEIPQTFFLVPSTWNLVTVASPQTRDLEDAESRPILFVTELWTASTLAPKRQRSGVEGETTWFQQPSFSINFNGLLRQARKMDQALSLSAPSLPFALDRYRVGLFSWNSLSRKLTKLDEPSAFVHTSHLYRAIIENVPSSAPTTTFLVVLFRSYETHTDAIGSFGFLLHLRNDTKEAGELSAPLTHLANDSAGKHRLLRITSVDAFRAQMYSRWIVRADQQDESVLSIEVLEASEALRSQQDATLRDKAFLTALLSGGGRKILAAGTLQRTKIGDSIRGSADVSGKEKERKVKRILDEDDDDATMTPAEDANEEKESAMSDIEAEGDEKTKKEGEGEGDDDEEDDDDDDGDEGDEGDEEPDDDELADLLNDVKEHEQPVSTAPSPTPVSSSSQPSAPPVVRRFHAQLPLHMQETKHTSQDFLSIQNINTMRFADQAEGFPVALFDANRELLRKGGKLESAMSRIWVRNSTSNPFELVECKENFSFANDGDGNIQVQVKLKGDLDLKDVAEGYLEVKRITEDGITLTGWIGPILPSSSSSTADLWKAAVRLSELKHMVVQWEPKLPTERTSKKSRESRFGLFVLDNGVIASLPSIQSLEWVPLGHFLLDKAGNQPFVATLQWSFDFVTDDVTNFKVEHLGIADVKEKELNEIKRILQIPLQVQHSSFDIVRLAKSQKAAFVERENGKLKSKSKMVAIETYKDGFLVKGPATWFEDDFNSAWFIIQLSATGGKPRNSRFPALIRLADLDAPIVPECEGDPDRKLIAFGARAIRSYVTRFLTTRHVVDPDTKIVYLRWPFNVFRRIGAAEAAYNLGAQLLERTRDFKAVSALTPKVTKKAKKAKAKAKAKAKSKSKDTSSSTSPPLSSPDLFVFAMTNIESSSNSSGGAQEFETTLPLVGAPSERLDVKLELKSTSPTAPAVILGQSNAVKMETIDFKLKRTEAPIQCVHDGQFVLVPANQETDSLRLFNREPTKTPSPAAVQYQLVQRREISNGVSLDVLEAGTNKKRLFVAPTAPLGCSTVLQEFLPANSQLASFSYMRQLLETGALLASQMPLSPPTKGLRVLETAFKQSNARANDFAYKLSDIHVAWLVEEIKGSQSSSSSSSSRVISITLASLRSNDALAVVELKDDAPSKTPIRVFYWGCHVRTVFGHPVTLCVRTQTNVAFTGKYACLTADQLSSSFGSQEYATQFGHYDAQDGALFVLNLPKVHEAMPYGQVDAFVQYLIQVQRAAKSASQSSSLVPESLLGVQVLRATVDSAAAWWKSQSSSPPSSPPTPAESEDVHMKDAQPLPSKSDQGDGKEEKKKTPSPKKDDPIVQRIQTQFVLADGQQTIAVQEELSKSFVDHLRSTWSKSDKKSKSQSSTLVNERDELSIGPRASSSTSVLPRSRLHLLAIRRALSLKDEKTKLPKAAKAKEGGVKAMTDDEGPVLPTVTVRYKAPASRPTTLIEPADIGNTLTIQPLGHGFYGHWPVLPSSWDVAHLDVRHEFVHIRLRKAPPTNVLQSLWFLHKTATSMLKPPKPEDNPNVRVLSVPIWPPEPLKTIGLWNAQGTEFVLTWDEWQEAKSEFGRIRSSLAEVKTKGGKRGKSSDEEKEGKSKSKAKAKAKAATEKKIKKFEVTVTKVHRALWFDNDTKTAVPIAKSAGDIGFGFPAFLPEGVSIKDHDVRLQFGRKNYSAFKNVIQTEPTRSRIKVLLICDMTDTTSVSLGLASGPFALFLDLGKAKFTQESKTDVMFLRVPLGDDKVLREERKIQQQQAQAGSPWTSTTVWKEEEGRLLVARQLGNNALDEKWFVSQKAFQEQLRDDALANIWLVAQDTDSAIDPETLSIIRKCFWSKTRLRELLAAPVVSSSSSSGVAAMNIDSGNRAPSVAPNDLWWKPTSGTKTEFRFAELRDGKRNDAANAGLVLNKANWFLYVEQPSGINTYAIENLEAKLDEAIAQVQKLTAAATQALLVCLGPYRDMLPTDWRAFAAMHYRSNLQVPTDGKSLVKHSVAAVPAQGVWTVVRDERMAGTLFAPASPKELEGYQGLNAMRRAFAAEGTKFIVHGPGKIFMVLMDAHDLGDGTSILQLKTYTASPPRNKDASLAMDKNATPPVVGLEVLKTPSKSNKKLVTPESLLEAAAAAVAVTAAPKSQSAKSKRARDDAGDAKGDAGGAKKTSNASSSALKTSNTSGGGGGGGGKRARQVTLESFVLRPLFKLAGPKTAADFNKRIAPLASEFSQKPDEPAFAQWQVNGGDDEFKDAKFGYFEIGDNKDTFAWIRKTKDPSLGVDILLNKQLLRPDDSYFNGRLVQTLLFVQATFAASPVFAGEDLLFVRFVTNVPVPPLVFRKVLDEHSDVLTGFGIEGTQFYWTRAS
jgi:hypothetical protein